MNNINPKIEDLFDYLKIGGSDRPLLKRGREETEQDRQEQARQLAARQLTAQQLAAQRLEEQARQLAAQQEQAKQLAAQQEQARQLAAQQEQARQLAAQQLAAQQEQARQEAAQLAARETIIYIFIHPVLTQRKLDFYKTQFNPIGNFKIIFVTSSFSQEDGSRYNSMDDLTKPKYDANDYRVESINTIVEGKDIKVKFNRFNQVKMEGLEGKQNSYDEFFDNNYEIYNCEERFSVIKYKPKNGVHTNGIGCKRFLSQIHHINNHNEKDYCAIDDLTILKSGHNNHPKDRFVESRTYEYAIKYIQYNKNAEHGYYGFRKCSSDGPNVNVTTQTKSIYKFILITNKEILNNIFYDPYCSNFKEDVDWLYRADLEGYKGLKFNKFIIFKENPASDINILSAGIPNNERTKENFYNYLYWYKDLTFNLANAYDSFVLFPTRGLLTNKFYILIIPMFSATKHINNQMLDFFGINFASQKRTLDAGLNPYSSLSVILNLSSGPYPVPDMNIYKYYNGTDTGLSAPCYKSSYNEKTTELMKVISEYYGGVLNLTLYNEEDRTIEIQIDHNPNIIPTQFKYNAHISEFTKIGDIHHTINPPPPTVLSKRAARLVARRGGSLFYDINYSS